MRKVHVGVEQREMVKTWCQRLSIFTPAMVIEDNMKKDMSTKEIPL
jgi:hypothetical protein